MRFVGVEFVRVNRPQPEAPQGGLQERAKSFDAVDAGFSDEGHCECGTVQVEMLGRLAARGKACGRPKVGLQDERVRQYPSALLNLPGERGRPF